MLISSYLCFYHFKLSKYEQTAKMFHVKHLRVPFALDRFKCDGRPCAELTQVAPDCLRVTRPCRGPSRSRNRPTRCHGMLYSGRPRPHRTGAWVRAPLWRSPLLRPSDCAEKASACAARREGLVEAARCAKPDVVKQPTGAMPSSVCGRWRACGRRHLLNRERRRRSNHR